MWWSCTKCRQKLKMFIVVKTVLEFNLLLHVYSQNTKICTSKIRVTEHSNTQQNTLYTVSITLNQLMNYITGNNLCVQCSCIWCPNSRRQKDAFSRPYLIYMCVEVFCRGFFCVTNENCLPRMVHLMLLL